MEKMRDPPFAEQALNLIKTRGLLNEMPKFERMNAYSEWREGLRAEHYLAVLLGSFSGSLRLDLDWWGRGGQCSPPPHQAVLPLALQTDVFFSQKRGVILEPPTAPTAKASPTLGRSCFISTTFPKLLTLRRGWGGGASRGRGASTSYPEKLEWMGVRSPSGRRAGMEEPEKQGEPTAPPSHPVNKRITR